MPRVFRGPAAPEEARAVAAYLASLKPAASEGLADPAPWRLLAPPPAAAVAGTEVGPLFESLHCAACHTPPDVAQAEEGKIPLRHVREKFPDGALADFLRRPSARYHWIRMPDFRLTASEASALAEGLLKLAPAPEGGAAPPAPAEAALLEKGKGLVQSSGCLNCHPHSLENRSRAPQFDTFKPESWTRGCLATGSEAGGGAPDFTLAPGVVAGLRAVGATDRTSLQRHVPSEFASRESRLLRCTACHGQFDGFPAFDVLGGKLRPEWAAAFIGGQVDYKPRGERHPKGEPWLSARMPAFGPYAALLAPGMAESSGFAPSSPPPAAARPPDEALAAVGRKLLGKVGGFSCVSCHGVNAMPALEVFESEGINLALTGSRIRREYFQRWMRLPLAVDPSTKMPAYFDEEGHSPLTEVFEGDALRQLEAIWEFLKLGEKMTPPELGEAK
ncbi:MAG TPA: hypothetical protein DCM86_20330 [Verrucomicrobiales bacterium]|nr:hypothetical protein [Verrucomicrobiales bacterium]